MEEVKGYFLIIAAASALIFINIYDKTMTAADTIRHVVFQVGSNDDIYRLFYGGF